MIKSVSLINKIYSYYFFDKKTECRKITLPHSGKYSHSNVCILRLGTSTFNEIIIETQVKQQNYIYSENVIKFYMTCLPLTVF